MLAVRPDHRASRSSVVFVAGALVHRANVVLATEDVAEAVRQVQHFFQFNDYLSAMLIICDDVNVANTCCYLYYTISKLYSILIS